MKLSLRRLWHDLFPSVAMARSHRFAKFPLICERLESRTLLSVGAVIKWTMHDDGVLGGVGDTASDIGEVGAQDPTIRLEVGARCIVTNVDYFTEPLEIVAKGANAFDDTLLLAEDSPHNPAESFASGLRHPGLFQNDPDVDFIDDQINHTISFTLTDALANAMTAGGSTPGYRCGNPLHRNSQRGDFLIVSGDVPDKSQQQLDGVGDSIDTAAPVLLTPDGLGDVSGAIRAPGNQDMYRLAPPASGLMNITLSPTSDSSLQNILFVYDKDGQTLAYHVAAAAGQPTAVQVDVVAGQTYFVEAADFTNSTGAYNLSFITTPTPSPFPGARLVPLDDSGAGSMSGTITTPTQIGGRYQGVVDNYYFVAPVTGLITITQDAGPGSAVDSQLSVFDQTSNLLASDDNGDGGLNSRVQLEVAAGHPYLVEASGRVYVTDVSGGQVLDETDSTGAYQLRFVTQDSGSAFATAHTTALDSNDSINTATVLDLSSGFVGQVGAIAIPGAADWFRFTAPASGSLRIRQFAVNGASLDSTFSVYNSAYTLLADADDDGSSLNSQVVMNVMAGQTYFIRAGGVGASTGRYQLTLSADNAADTFSTAPFLDASSGSAIHDGYIGGAGDVDLFRFTAPLTGSLPVELTTPPQSLVGDPTLDGQLTIFDASGKPIVQDNGSAGGYDAFLTVKSLLTVNVTRGATYYVGINGFATSSGTYRLVIGKEYGSSVANAFPVPLDASGSAHLSGSIIPKGQDWFQFTSTVSGPLAVVEATAPLSNLTGQITVYDDGNPTPHMLGSARNNSGNPATVLLTVTAGHVYYVQVQGVAAFPFGPATTGAYDLYVSVPSANSTADAAKAVDPATGSAMAAGNIAFPSASDWFKFQAPVTGMLGVQQSDPGNSFLIDTVTVYDGSSVPSSSSVPLATNTGFGQTFTSVQIPVTAGQTYYINATGFQNSTGFYNLSLVMLPTSGPQLRPTDLGSGATAQDLVNSLLGPGSGITVEPGTVHYTGNPLASGVFSGGSGIVGFESGALLTTGFTTDVVGPNFTEGSPGTDNGQPGDSDLDQLVQGGTHSAAVLSFDFIPSVNVVQLSYVFASSEYSRFASSVFDDVFGAFVNGVDYARIPGTGSSAPGSGDLVSVNTVNGRTNATYFIDNSIGPDGGLAPLDTQMNGLTTVLTLSAPVIPGQPNHMELAIANVVDPHYPSAVFLQGGSFHTKAETPNASLGFETLVQASGLGAKAINQAVVDELTKNRPVLGAFLVIPVDPVDFTLTGPSGLRITQTQQGLSQSSGTPVNPFYESAGINTLLIIPNAAPGAYYLDLVGIGTGNFQLGASYVSAFGQVTSVLLGGSAQISNTQVVLDFRHLDGRVEQQTLAVAEPEPTTVASVPLQAGSALTLTPFSESTESAAPETAASSAPPLLRTLVAALLTAQTGSSVTRLDNEAQENEAVADLPAGARYALVIAAQTKLVMAGMPQSLPDLFLLPVLSSGGRELFTAPAHDAARPSGNSPSDNNRGDGRNFAVPPAHPGQGRPGQVPPDQSNSDDDAPGAEFGHVDGSSLRDDAAAPARADSGACVGAADKPAAKRPTPLSSILAASVCLMSGLIHAFWTERRSDRPAVSCGSKANGTGGWPPASSTG